MPYPLELNPHRHYYTTRHGRILGIVLHVTAGAEDTGMVGPDGSAEGTIRYGQTTDRPASWHGIVDTDTIVDCLPDHYTAFHCKGVNAAGLGLEIANRDAKWAGKPPRWVDATLANAAAWCAPRVAKYGLPIRLATAAEVQAAIAADRPFGFTYHSRMDPSRRVDPGADFPWARFAQLLTTSPITPAQEDEMTLDDLIEDRNPYQLRDGKGKTVTVRQLLQDTQANAAYAARQTADHEKAIEALQDGQEALDLKLAAILAAVTKGAA